MIITIDGPAGSGKSTVAEILAKTLGFFHFNSGSLYRAVTAYILDKNIDINRLKDFDFDGLKIEVKYLSGVQHVFVNSIDFTDKLRLNDVSVATPIVSKEKRLREKIDFCQRDFGSKHNIVIDGRDTGSFVFPNADIKFYLDCDLDVRAKRRFDEENARLLGHSALLDSNREHAGETKYENSKNCGKTKDQNSKKTSIRDHEFVKMHQQLDTLNITEDFSKAHVQTENKNSIPVGKPLSFEQIKKEIAARDEIDKNKKIAPLVVPKGAVIIDSSNRTISEVVEIMMSHIMPFLS